MEQHFWRHRALGKGIVVLERPIGTAHAAIVLMHPVAGRNGFLGKADDLPELDDGLPGTDRAQREFMALGHATDDVYTLRGLRAHFKIAEGHADIVGSVEHQRSGLGADHRIGHRGSLRSSQLLLDGGALCRQIALQPANDVARRGGTN
jgi:hypothetical protein